MDGLTLRVADPSDSEAIASIYRPYVESTAITFEETPPDPEAIATDIRTRLETHPWFVAESEGDVLGYAYAAPLRKRDAYRWTVELSIYLDRERRGRGLGSTLYTALLETLDRQGFESAYGVVTLPNPESVGFHESFGFERAGLLPEAGYKLGTWHDVAWYERSLGDPSRSQSPPDPTPFAACRTEPWLEDLLALSGSSCR
jgi:phosphinothricin acetyltransferase